ncbi:hypothetical protein OIN60_02185 [Paenibacillus sp. P96]|uniref:Uncharacterized protein n=1 Tax=Paenibacillus zeirhizosphaerae TaxID=2987519 RepID=A0ABT9FLZ1_9BACL|nr:hypothetical protein [Paenibacillus sp. P96]MDP4095600.1 hypothetical protein [Paenibacillus sp. P96]
MDKVVKEYGLSDQLLYGWLQNCLNGMLQRTPFYFGVLMVLLGVVVLMIRNHHVHQLRMELGH